jgi:myo-inositol-1(or 4)-monophosphatase
MLGTTLPFAKLATGALAAAIMVPSDEPSEPLHFAAGCALAEAAGAIVTDAYGQPWRPWSSGFIAAATVELHARLLTQLTEALRAPR